MERKSLAYDPFQPIGRYCRQIINELRKTVTPAIRVIVLKIVVAVLSVLLSLLILLHKGKGGGLSDMFGGGLTANAGTSGVAERNLNRWTVGIAILWAVLIIAIGLIGKLT